MENSHQKGTANINTDKCISFYLDRGAFRGQFCRVQDSISEALSLHTYPEKINSLLAEMVTLSTCFSMDIKSDSKTTMQLTGTSPVKLALVNLENSQAFRCCSSFDSQIKSSLDNISIPNLFGQDGKLVLTIDFENQYYQTIIDLSGESFQECFQQYFIQSQQIPTIVIVASSCEDKVIKCAALILQRVPSSSNINESFDDTWHSISCFAATLKPDELLNNSKSMEHLINLVFGEHAPVVSRETNLFFKCTCNQQKLEELGKMLELKEDEKYFEAVCEYCNRNYIIKA